MKKMVSTTLLTTAMASMLFTGCTESTTPSAQVKKQMQGEANFRCRQDGVLAPKWTCNPYVEGAIAAVGIAQVNAGHDKSMQRSEAMADGRDALASQISIKVSNLFKSYKATTGAGGSATFDASTSKVSKQLASQTLNGSRAFESWQNPQTKELYLLVAISNEPVKKAMDKAIKTSYKNDKALYQQFLAAKANGELDAELEKAGLQ